MPEVIEVGQMGPFFENEYIHSRQTNSVPLSYLMLDVFSRQITSRMESSLV